MPCWILGLHVSYYIETSMYWESTNIKTQYSGPALMPCWIMGSTVNFTWSWLMLNHQLCPQWSRFTEDRHCMTHDCIRLIQSFLKIYLLIWFCSFWDSFQKIISGYLFTSNTWLNENEPHEITNTVLLYVPVWEESKRTKLHQRHLLVQN